MVLDSPAKLDALPALAAASRRFLDRDRDAVFVRAHGRMQHAGAVDGRHRSPGGNLTAATTCWPSLRQIDMRRSSRTHRHLHFHPLKNARRAAAADPAGAVFQAGELARSTPELPVVETGAAPPFYFARVDARTFAREVGRWTAFRFPGGADERLIAMPTLSRRRYRPFPAPRDWWLLAAGLCVLFVFCLGSRGLNEPDEGRYAIMGEAMAQPGGDWWEPRLSGYAPLRQAAAAVLGDGAELPRVRLQRMGGARAAAARSRRSRSSGLGWAAWRLYGERVAWWAVLICGTSPCSSG